MNTCPQKMNQIHQKEYAHARTAYSACTIPPLRNFLSSILSSPSQPFLIECLLQSRNLFGAPHNRGLNPFADPAGHLGAPCWP